jgi:hypothetical protein
MGKYKVYQDESGVCTNEDYFIIGVLFINLENENTIRNIIREIRDEHRFNDEMHFQKMSNRRYEVYREVLEGVIRFGRFKFDMIIVDKKDIDYKCFGGKNKLGNARIYNKFTEMRIFHSIKKIENSKCYIFTDEKSRIKEDNFLSYLKDHTNFELWLKKCTSFIKTVEPIDSKSDDLMQLNDLLLGGMSEYFNITKNLSERKKILAQIVYNYIINHKNTCNIWRLDKNKRKK